MGLGFRFRELGFRGVHTTEVDMDYSDYRRMLSLSMPTSLQAKL